MAKAHDHVREGLHLDQLESKTGQSNRYVYATLVGGVLLICSFIATFVYESPEQAGLLGALAALLLGTPLVVVAIKDLMHGHMHMNELVALAVLAAFAIGEYQESAAIAFLMIISVLIENRTALGAQKSVEELVRITPTRAHRLADGREEEVDARELHPGDLVRVRPGDNIPADGTVRTGESTVNQATITGESLPADKHVGDEVYSGTINLTGVMDIEVSRVAQDTTLGRVKELILQAESTRIPIMRMIDRYAVWYTPTVLMIVFIVWFFTFSSGGYDSWERIISMLVIACPCALILATPTAMVAGLSSATRLGVYVKDVVDLEAARNLTAIVFDKTGTLTTGELEVTMLRPAEGVEGADLLRAAASVEQNSRHPVARAVTTVAQRANLAIGTTSGFEEVSGRGVSGQVEGQQVHVGRADWITSQSWIAPDQAKAIGSAQSSSEADGLSVLFVMRDRKLLGWVGLADNTRPQAAAAMDRLRDLGLKRLIIVTGDRESVARRVAGQMRTDFLAEVLPHEKLELVDELKGNGHRVAVVGDGVNDAPALKAGDISIAMGAAGSDVAIHSASIALMNNNLDRIPFLIDLSRRTSRVVKQNMVIGVGFISGFMTLAALGWISPIAAALLHVVSGLIVIFNSARLVRSGEDIEHAEAGRGTAAPPARPQPPPEAQVATVPA